jgi:transcriptional regulator with XRE-family HTH domain
MEHLKMQQNQPRRFGEWLRQRRQEARLSTTELARRADTTDATIVRIEHGQISAPAADKLARIAEALEVSLADVYAMAGYAVPAELPSFQPYLRRKYSQLPAGAIRDLDEAFASIVKRHGYVPEGPRHAEDEIAEDPLIK